MSCRPGHCPTQTATLRVETPERTVGQSVDGDVRCRLCYFTNVYPAPSHTTMRREITALEALGWRVLRVAARPFPGALVDESDQIEAAVTSYTACSIPRAALAVLVVAARHPLKLGKAIADAFRVGISSRSGVWKHLMYVGEACVLLKFVRDCIHLHANFGNATSIAVMCRILGGPPVSLRIHGPEEYETFSRREWEWRAIHASFLAPISEFGATCLNELLAPRHHGKVHLIRCGVDDAVLCVDPTPLPSSMSVVCVARLEARKGHVVLLAAIRQLRDVGLHVKLRLVGHGSLRAELERCVDELALRDLVAFDGWADGSQVLSAISRSRVVVLPSFAEGLPIVLMEAFALRRPVVATAVAGVPELVIPGETGWLVAPGDPDNLALAIATALQSPDEKLEELARRGRSVVMEKHCTTMLMAMLSAKIAEKTQEELQGAPPGLLAMPRIAAE